jgi:multiple sugar transport system ATP-binding protein
MANVELKKVSKIYTEDVKAVDSADIEINDKEFVVLVGPSGCGKTTTLRMIAGLEEISEGELLIDGKLVNELPPKDRDIAMVFQNYALYPHMSVYDNMAFGLKMRKFDKDEIDKRVREAAVILGIEDYLKRKPKELSGGQRQRVAVGRAIVRKPKVFLFDEPLSNLDAKLRVQMRTELSRLHNQLGATMIYVTHDQIEAMTMADRIVVMKDGKIQQIGGPLELYNNPVNKFVAGFIGSPPMNFIEMEISKTGNRAELRDENIYITIPEKIKNYLESNNRNRVCFGIRPENLEKRKPEEGECFIKAEIDVIEPLGDEIHLYLKGGDHRLLARIPSDLSVSIGETLFFIPDMRKSRFFETVSENAIENSIS